MRALCTWQFGASVVLSWRTDEAMVCLSESLLFFSFVIRAAWHCCGSKRFVASRSNAAFWANGLPAWTCGRRQIPFVHTIKSLNHACEVGYCHMKANLFMNNELFPWYWVETFGVLVIRFALLESQRADWKESVFRGGEGRSKISTCALE